MGTIPVEKEGQQEGGARNGTRASASSSISSGSFSISQQTARNDYKTAWVSRHISLLGRKEVLNGRAKFGIFGAGKEIAQVAMAHAFKKGDTRAGYYRDQTLMLALGLTTPHQLFAALYAHTDVEAEPTTAGRSMNSHFGTRQLDEDGNWRSQLDGFNSSADISPTAGQMPRLVGLAYASRLYREVDVLKSMQGFSNKGREVAFGTIGNASCAEGLFWESLNAIGVLQAPAVISIYDDDYGISVPNEYQFTKGNVGALLKGFQREEGDRQGYNIYTVKGWNYAGLMHAYAKAAADARTKHIPAIIHVIEMTQPQGHSTSGSHERYKSEARLAWEQTHDPLIKMRKWLLENRYATEEELDEMEAAAKKEAWQARKEAWTAFNRPQKSDAEKLMGLLEQAIPLSRYPDRLQKQIHELKTLSSPLRKDIYGVVHRAIKLLHHENHPHYMRLLEWRKNLYKSDRLKYHTHLHSESDRSPLRVTAVPPTYGENPKSARGFEILQQNFDAILAKDPRVVIFGEDVGHLGDVNQALAGLQAKYGALRVSDTGIREATIVGQAIGLAQRGLRPIAEIQYLDYIHYAIPPLTDDLASLHWRTKGGQKAPVIVRTRGHRLEGIWHSGSPMGAMLGLLRGLHIVVPRNMTQAAGFYNTLLQGDDPALVVERLNAYRFSEPVPNNPGEYCVPLGVPEVLREGEDVTLVTYGANCDIALEAVERLAEEDIFVELIDVQSLLPFDIHHMIRESVQRTGRLVVVDEDVPGGASAFIMQQILEVQKAFMWLDSEPVTITAQPHRPAYGTDGDYFSKPSVEQIVERVYAIMHESHPAKYPLIWRTEEQA